jgi:exopolysaccharide biosynthesis polyprenyl glycosylphosphotransferase
MTMTDVGAELTRTPSLAGLLPLQRRPEPGIEVLSPGEPASATIEGAALAPAGPIELPVVKATSKGLPDRVLLLSADGAAAAVAAVVDWQLGLLAAAVLLPATAVTGLQRRRFSLSVLDDAPRALASLCFVLAVLVARALSDAMPVSDAVLAATAVAGGLFLFRSLAYARIRALRRAGRTVLPVVLVGPTSEQLAHRLRERPETGVRVVGLADAQGKVRLSEGGTAAIDSVVRRHAVRALIIDPTGNNEAMVRWVRNLVWRDLSVHMVLPQVGAAPMRGWDDQIWGVPLVRMRAGLRWRRMRIMKRLTDVVVAGGALLALAPLLGVVAFFVRREVGPSIIFRQQRVGMDGRTFDVLKFRSMRDLPAGQESPWSAQATSPDRVGPVGRFIRKYSIDELPQLWNVVRGDMSLVGPRPERPHYVEEFSTVYPHYGSRHRAPVGLTGLAAVEGLRGDTSIADRAHFDNLYVDSWSFWQDLKIVARTVVAVVRGTGS